MKCCKCPEDSAHSIQVREGTPPNPMGPRSTDVSSVQVKGFCPAHWNALMDFILDDPA